MWMLGTKFQPYGRVAHALNCWAMSPALASIFELDIFLGPWSTVPACLLSLLVIKNHSLEGNGIISAPTAPYRLQFTPLHPFALALPHFTSSFSLQLPDHFRHNTRCKCKSLCRNCLRNLSNGKQNGTAGDRASKMVLQSRHKDNYVTVPDIRTKLSSPPTCSVAMSSPSSNSLILSDS